MKKQDNKNYLDEVFNNYVNMNLQYKELFDYNLDINDNIVNIINRIIHSKNIIYLTKKEKNYLDNYFQQYEVLKNIVGPDILCKLCSTTQLEFTKDTIHTIFAKRKNYIITFIESDFLQVYFIIYENWEVVLNNLLNSILKLSKPKFDKFVKHPKLQDVLLYFKNENYDFSKNEKNYLDSFMYIHNLFKNISKGIHTIINRIENTQNWNIKNKDLFDFKYQISDIFTILLTFNQLYFILDDISGSGINKLYKPQVLNHYCSLNTHKQNLGYFNNNLLFNIDIKEKEKEKETETKIETNNNKTKNTEKSSQSKRSKKQKTTPQSFGFMSFEDEANMKCEDFSVFFKSVKKKNYTNKIIDINKFILHQDLDYFNYLYINNFQNIKKQKSYQNVYSKLTSTFIDFI
jgi:hypothetical protein